MTLPGSRNQTQPESVEPQTVELQDVIEIAHTTKESAAKAGGEDCGEEYEQAEFGVGERPHKRVTEFVAEKADFSTEDKQPEITAEEGILSADELTEVIQYERESRIVTPVGIATV